MKTSKINRTTENFLTYSFRGDGKYYTTEKGSRHYRNTTFQKFAKNNPVYFKIIESGNNAPRGGQTGDFVVVEFTETFKDIAKKFIDKMESDKKVIQDAKDAKIATIQKYVSLIPKIDNELRIDTEKRMSIALNGEKIPASTFHKAVSLVRK